MSNEFQDRQRRRQELQDLAKLAPARRDYEDRYEGSGFIDLASISAASAAEPGWIERELERARMGVPAIPGLPGAPRAPLASMAPVALTSLLPPDERSISRRVSVGVSIGSVVLVGLLAILVARQEPPPAVKDATSLGLPEMPAATGVSPQAASVAAQTARAGTQPAAAAATRPATLSASDLPLAARPAVAHAAAVQASAPRSAPVAAVAAAMAPKPADPPAPKAAGANDALMDMMRASVKK